MVLSTLLILLVFLAISFLFSGFETGAISINQITLEQEAKKSKSKAQLLAFIRKPDRLLGTTLIGNNISNVILASVATFVAHELQSQYFPAQYTSLLIGTLVLMFGEIMPKSIFRDHADKIVPMFFPLIMFFYYILKPFVAIVSYINTKLRKWLKIEDSNQFNYLTRDDLTFLLSQATDDKMSDPQLEMIEDALDFHEQDAVNVMIPRTDIVAIPESATIPEIIEIAKKEGFTRYPVYRQNLDDIVGILILYDILKKDCTPEVCAGQIIHEALFVPENMDLDVLLKEMQLKRRSMAIVVDAYGGTSGLVTIEDILEEIVGDIEDEYDTEEDNKEVEQVAPNTWLVQADVDIDRLADEYNIELPEGDYETLAGLILDQLERIPVQGQSLTIAEYRIQILQATDKKIIKVKLHKTRGES
jgi:CBS domain containing-hemolysin-like protein